MLSAAFLLGACALPIAVPRGASLLTGQSLSTFGPHLLTSSSETGLWIWVSCFVCAAALAVLSVMGAARLVGQVLSALMAITSALLFLFSLLLLLGMSIVLRRDTDQMTMGLGLWCLPIGTALCFLSCVVPNIRRGWVRPKAF